MEYIRNLDLLKASGYIDRVVKSDFYRKNSILLHTRATFSGLPSDISTMVPTHPSHQLTYSHYHANLEYNQDRGGYRGGGESSWILLGALIRAFGVQTPF